MGHRFSPELEHVNWSMCDDFVGKLQVVVRHVTSLDVLLADENTGSLNITACCTTIASRIFIESFSVRFHTTLLRFELIQPALHSYLQHLDIHVGLDRI